MLRLLRPSSGTTFTHQDCLGLLTVKLKAYLDSTTGHTINQVDKIVVDNLYRAANYLSLLIYEDEQVVSFDDDAVVVLDTLKVVVTEEWMMPSDISLIRVHQCYKALQRLIRRYHKHQHAQQAPGLRGTLLRLVG